MEDGGCPTRRSGRRWRYEPRRTLGKRGDNDRHGRSPESGVPRPAGAPSTPPGFPILATLSLVGLAAVSSTAAAAGGRTGIPTLPRGAGMAPSHQRLRR